jgi:hypothetical protein
MNKKTNMSLHEFYHYVGTPELYHGYIVHFMKRKIIQNKSNYIPRTKQTKTTTTLKGALFLIA